MPAYSRPARTPPHAPARPARRGHRAEVIADSDGHANRLGATVMSIDVSSGTTADGSTLRCLASTSPQRSERSSSYGQRRRRTVRRRLDAWRFLGDDNPRQQRRSRPYGEKLGPATCIRAHFARTSHVPHFPDTEEIAGYEESPALPEHAGQRPRSSSRSKGFVAQMAMKRRSLPSQVEHPELGGGASNQMTFATWRRGVSSQVRRRS